MDRLLEQIHLPIIVHQQEKIVVANRLAMQILRASTAEQIIGHSIWDFYLPKQHNVLQNRNKLILETKAVLPPIDCLLKKIDHTTIKVKTSVALITYNQQPALMTIIFTIDNKNETATNDTINVNTIKHDLITGLANRAAFEDRLGNILNSLKTPERNIAVLFIDIDSFNSINEFLGHDAGDQLLRIVAARLSTLDTPLANIARFGPKFAIIIENITCVEDVTRFVQTINALFNAAVVINEHKFIIYLNYGISLYPEDGTNVHDLISSASIALGAAKAIGGGTLQFCTNELHAQIQQKIIMEQELRTALPNQEFILYYQPIVAIDSMCIVGFEALLRWQKNNNLVSPAEFIPLAEKTRLIIPIGEWVINTACAQSAAWQTTFKSDIFVSVNVSPVQFKNSAVLDTLVTALNNSQLKVECLKLEVTESTLMESEQKSIAMLQAIQDMGIKIAIDDFGTGYSSLSYLRFLPIDYLKIDQSFVRNMITDIDAAVIVKTVIDLAHNLDYKVIAEGVETVEQLKFLAKLGCDYVQGYLFSKPMPAADAQALLHLDNPYSKWQNLD